MSILIQRQRRQALTTSSACTQLLMGGGTSLSLQTPLCELHILLAGLAGVFTACLVGATLLLLTPVFEHMPLSALGAIVISGVIGLVNCDEAVFLWRVRNVQGLDVHHHSAARCSRRWL